MFDASLHLAPNAPWPLLALGSLALAALAVWAYTFALPPLSPVARRALTLARGAVLLALLWLLAQPVLERALPASGRRVLVLVDRSTSMELPASRGGPSRATVATRVAGQLARALRSRARVETRAFAASLDPDTSRGGGALQSTALGDAIAALADLPLERRPDGVVLVSDGIVNVGADPVAAAKAIGVPVHAVLVGEPLGADRAISEVEAPLEAHVGVGAPVRVHVLSSETRGTKLGVRLFEDGREIARTRLSAPGPGAEVVAELQVSPVRAGLALWTARVDALAGDAVPGNDARGVALPISPGRIGILVVSAGLNWDLAFLRRAWLGDSGIALETRVREPDGWRALESGRDAAPAAADLRGKAFVVLDGIAATEAGAAFDRALADFVRRGGGLLLLGGSAPGLARYARGALAPEMTLSPAPGQEREAAPEPSTAAGELLGWDADPARGEQAWRVAAPLASVQPLQPGAGDHVLLAAQGGGAPLMFSRRAGRGPVLLVNGGGFWRWALSGTDPLAALRSRSLWRRVARWLAEPVQGEPLRVRPEHWLTPAGEPVRLFATLQDATFQPLGGALVEGEATDGRGGRWPLTFVAGEPGSYIATLASPRAGRWQLSARATRGGHELARASGEFAVDTWSLEQLRAEPDSTTLAAVAGASGGRTTIAARAAAWAEGIETRALTRRRSASSRLWESPWVFGLIVAALAAEWIWRRRRGLP